jgi:hypothetical protein
LVIYQTVQQGNSNLDEKSNRFSPPKDINNHHYPESGISENKSARPPNGLSSAHLILP